MAYGSALLGLLVGSTLGFLGGFVFHALRWPLSEEAVAVEAEIWRKRASEAEYKLRKINKESER